MNRKAITNYKRLRVALIHRGVTIRQFALAQKLPLRSVYSAARGERFGVKSALILKKLEAFAYEQ